MVDNSPLDPPIHLATLSLDCLIQLRRVQDPAYLTHTHTHTHISIRYFMHVITSRLTGRQNTSSTVYLTPSCVSTCKTIPDKQSTPNNNLDDSLVHMTFKFHVSWRIYNLLSLPRKSRCLATMCEPCSLEGKNITFLIRQRLMQTPTPSNMLVKLYSPGRTKS